MHKGRFSWLELGTKSTTEQAGESLSTQSDLDERICLETAHRLVRQAQFESALQWYSKALRFTIDCEEAWLGQVQCLLFLGENIEANIWADRALERFQNSPDILAAKALAYDRLNNTAAAMSYSDASLEIKGRRVGAYPWIVRGELLCEARRSRPAALRCFNKAKELAGKDWYTYYLIGKAFMREGCYDQALENFIFAVNLERGSAVLYCALGECREALGELKDALSAYRRAREADPLCREAKIKLEKLENMGILRRIWHAIRKCV